MVDETYTRVAEALAKKDQQVSENIEKLDEAMAIQVEPFFENIEKLGEAMADQAKQWQKLQDSLLILERVRVVKKKKRRRKASHKGRGGRHRYGKPK